MKKKIISLLMVGTMVASITACGGSSSDSTEDTSTLVGLLSSFLSKFIMLGQ